MCDSVTLSRVLSKEAKDVGQQNLPNSTGAVLSFWILLKALGLPVTEKPKLSSKNYSGDKTDH